MNYTQNYHLPQWVKEDRIMMEDFNAAMSSMESGMTRAEGKADTAISTANTAHSLAQQTADAAYSPDNKPYVVGHYRGDGQTCRDITLGFRPSFVLLWGDQRAAAVSTCGSSIMAAGPNQSSLRLYLTDTGFQVDGSETVNPYPNLNLSGKTYEYIAFR